MIQVFEDLQLSVFVFFVLINFLYCYNLKCLFISCFMNNSEGAISYSIFKSISIYSWNRFTLFFPLLFVFTMEGYRRLIFFVVKYFVNSDAMSLWHDIFVFVLSVQLCWMLFECNWFDWFNFLHIESLALIIEFLVFSEWLSESCLIVETDFLRIFVGLGLYPSRWVLSTGSHLHFQITYHLNDHYYISKLNYYITLHHINMETAKPQHLKISYLKCQKEGLHED